MVDYGVMFLTSNWYLLWDDWVLLWDGVIVVLFLFKW